MSEADSTIQIGPLSHTYVRDLDEVWWYVDPDGTRFLAGPSHSLAYDAVLRRDRRIYQLEKAISKAIMLGLEPRAAEILFTALEANDDDA